MVMYADKSKVMEQKRKLSIGELLAELKQFSDGNTLGESENHAKNILREYLDHQARDDRSNSDTGLIERFGASLPAVLSGVSGRTKYIKEKYVRNFASAHEMYGALAEEVHELFTEVCKNEGERDNQKIRNEALDIAVVVIRFLAEEQAKLNF